jgi:hypothetical protein
MGTCKHVEKVKTHTYFSQHALRRGDSAGVEANVELGLAVIAECRQVCGEQSPYQESLKFDPR